MYYSPRSTPLNIKVPSVSKPLLVGAVFSAAANLEAPVRIKTCTVLSLTLYCDSVDMFDVLFTSTWEFVCLLWKGTSLTMLVLSVFCLNE